MRLFFFLCLFSIYLCAFKCPTVEPYISQVHIDNRCLNKTSQDQINVLLDFYSSLNGQNWILRGNWLNMSVSVCDWGGITCDSGCNIIQFAMYANNLKGTLPSLTNLTKLDNIALLCNYIEGGISQFSDMPQLTFININSNEINEVLPSLSQSINLLLLDLGGNHITGTIDYTTLPNSVYLQTLILCDNKLDGNIPTMLNNYKYLVNLLLNNNNFTGAIPDFDSSLLQLLSLSNNNLVGSIPSSIFSKHLINLDLSNNQLSGDIPNSWCNLKLLQDLYLNNNLLSGNFNTSGNYISCRIIDVSDNRLSGTIDNINTFQVDTLNLSNNNFSGDIGINFSAISYLDIRNNYDMRSNMDENSLKCAFIPVDIYTIQDDLICNGVKIRLVPYTSVLLSDPQYLNYLYCKNITC